MDKTPESILREIFDGAKKDGCYEIDRNFFIENVFEHHSKIRSITDLETWAMLRRLRFQDVQGLFIFYSN